jgi:lysophospholipase L1-like esterase
MNYFPARSRKIFSFVMGSLLCLGLSGPGRSQQQQPQDPTATPPPIPMPKLVFHRGLENAASLTNFFQQLDRLKRKSALEPLRIAHFGDSHVAADILTADIRHRFQADFGDGGAGLLIPHNPFSTPRRGVESGVSSGWTVDGIGKDKPGNDGAYGMAGISLTADKANETLWVKATTNHFEAYVLKCPLGGTIDVTVDGASILDEPMNLKSATTTVDFVSFDTPLVGEHRIEVKTLTPGKTRVLGIASEEIQPGAGVCYDVLGINGARASRVLGWNQKILMQTLKFRTPNLIIFAYGTNEVTDDDWSIESYSRMLVNIIKEMKAAAPDAAVIIYGPPDRSDQPAATSKMPAMIEAQKRAAREAGAAFWSSYDAMGGSGAMDYWITQGWGRPDHVHLTSPGYQRMADMFYDDVKQAYVEWKKHPVTRTRRVGRE